MTPIEMIAEWRKGCPNTMGREPIECKECTDALINALERRLTEFATDGGSDRPTGTPFERATLAVIAELHRQGAARGVAVEDNGLSAQVDGAFPVQPLVLAVIPAIREPSEGMFDAAQDEARAAGVAIRQHEIEGIWWAMIDKLLEQGRS